jgi:hypothetical protein
MVPQHAFMFIALVALVSSDQPADVRPAQGLLKTELKKKCRASSAGSVQRSHSIQRAYKGTYDDLGRPIIPANLTQINNTIQQAHADLSRV